MRLAYQFQGRKVKGYGHQAHLCWHTLCAISSEWQGHRSSNLVHGWRTTSRISTSKVKDRGHKVRWSVWDVSKTNSRSTIKIGRRAPHDTWYITHHFQGQRWKVKVTGRLTQTYKMCVRHKNFKVGVRMEDVDKHQQRAPWPPRLKVTRSHDMSDPCGPYYEICTWYTLINYQDGHYRQSRWPPRSKVKVISSHRLYVSSLLLLNSGNKMLYPCH